MINMLKICIILPKLKKNIYKYFIHKILIYKDKYK